LREQAGATAGNQQIPVIDSSESSVQDTRGLFPSDPIARQSAT